MTSPLPDMDVDLPVDDAGDDQPGNLPAADDVPEARAVEPPV